jgi:hypothetical protein
MEFASRTHVYLHNTHTNTHRVEVGYNVMKENEESALL